MKTQVNLYDFDHTLYRGDSTLDFYLFCIRRNPLLLKYLPIQVSHALLFIVGLENRTKFKSNFFIFLRGLNHIDQCVEQFWGKYKKKIKKWYTSTDFKSGVVISASPDFLLRPMLEMLGPVSVIATDTDKKTGIILGQNCRGEEKVRRFREQYPDAEVAEAYSDSLADLPMLKLAKKAFIVRGENLSPLDDR